MGITIIYKLFTLSFEPILKNLALVFPNNRPLSSVNDVIQTYKPPRNKKVTQVLPF